uniref:Uncharacterized protein n=1 Tax=Onchocerca volvulus TaxID=6282 RepID=A0A8R1XZU6_ONCVO
MGIADERPDLRRANWRENITTAKTGLAHMPYLLVA